MFIVLLIAVSLTITPLVFAAEKSETTEKTEKKKAVKKKVEDTWSVYQHDMRHSGQSSFKAPMKPTVLWVVPFGETGKPSTPMAVTKDGIAFVGVLAAPKEDTETTESAEGNQDSSPSSSGVFAFGEGKKVIWVSSEKGAVTGPLAIGKDGTVFAVIGTSLVAIDPKNGETNWKIALNGESPGGVMLDGAGNIYVGTLGGQTLYAVTKDGDLKWALKVDGQIDSSPAIGSDGTVYFTAKDLSLYAAEPNGTLKWKYTVNVSETTSISSPVLAKDNTAYFTATRYEGTPGLEFLYAINPNGNLKWRFETMGKKSTMPALSKDGTVVFGTTILNYTEDRSLTIGEAYAQGVNPDGTEKWLFKVRDDDFLGAPVIDAEGNIYLSTPDWYMLCLAKSGTMRWRAKIGGLTSIGPEGSIYVAAKSSVAAVGDKDVIRAKQKDKDEDGQKQGGFGAGGPGSFLIYIIPVAIVIGIVYLLKSRIGTREEDEPEKTEPDGG